MFMVDNSDGLLTGLNMLSRKELTRGRGGLFLSKAEKLQYKLERKQHQLDKMMLSIEKQKEKIAELQKPREEVVKIK